MSTSIYSATCKKAQAKPQSVEQCDRQKYWKTLLPYLHPLQWAMDHPSHCPRKEEILHAIENKGQKGCCTFDRGEYKVRIRYLGPWAFEKSITEQRKLYYVSRGSNRQALLYLDADHHKPYQSPADTQLAKAIINDWLGKHLQIGGNRWVTSGGGQNGYLPVISDSVSPQHANPVFDRFQNALRLILAEAGCIADIEIKGRLSYLDRDSGAFEWKQFGKLPLSAEDFRLDTLDGIFERKLNLNQLERLVTKIEQQIPAEVLRKHQEDKAALAKEYVPTHVLLSPEVEHRLREAGTWKMAMATRQVREDGEWIQIEWVENYPNLIYQKKEEICLVEKCMVKEPAAPLSETRFKRFWSYVKELAINGVPEDDNLSNYLFELARPLLFREYYYLTPEGRIEKTVADLISWVTTKHNGRITRIEAKMSEVISQVERVVNSAVKQTDESLLFYFAQMRANDEKYPHRIEMLSPLIGQSTIEEEEKICLVEKCMVKKPIDTPLPGSVEAKLIEIAKVQKMRRRDGEFPFVKFARRILNACWVNKGRAHISRETLQGYLGGGKDPNPQLSYKKLLARHGLIYGDWERYIRRGRNAALYRLTESCFGQFQEAFVESQVSLSG